MQLRSDIIIFRQEDRDPLRPTWERMEESVRKYPNHGWKSGKYFIYFIMQLTQYPSMLDIATRSTFMEKEIDKTKKKSIDDMQDKHAQ